MACDERTKGAISATEAATVIATGFTVPTSLARTTRSGARGRSEDCASSATPRADEAPFYANAASFTAVIQPDAGP